MLDFAQIEIQSGVKTSFLSSFVKLLNWKGLYTYICCILRTIYYLALQAEFACQIVQKLKKYIYPGGGVAPAPELDRFLLNYFSIQ